MEALTVSSSDKAALRRRFREARENFIAQQGEDAAERLSQNLSRFLADHSSAQVALYRPMKDEARFELPSSAAAGAVATSATSTASTDAATDSTTYFYPRLTGEGEMELFSPKRSDAFLSGRFGILEPDPAHSRALQAESPLVVCCPAVAVDWRGQRLGQGQGYYDRFFARNPKALRVGVVYQIQVASDPLPADSWDQPLDWIVTEEMILRTSNRSS